jgi:site-specific recombinase XerD
MANKPSTTTVTVFTRHGTYKGVKCPKIDPQWKRCKCRKSLYIYENGRVTNLSARTRSWEEAEKFAQAERDKRDPRNIELARIEEAEAAKRAAEIAKLGKRTTVIDALAGWLGTKKSPSKSSATTYKTFVRKVKDWAEAQGIVFMDEVTKLALGQWRSAWSPTARIKDNRMGSRTQHQHQQRVQEFFGWAFKNDIIDRDPSVALEPIKVVDEETQPINPEQFVELLAATEKYDAKYLSTAERDRGSRFGLVLRSLFIIMRWTGLRIGDVLMLPRAALIGDRLHLTTQKTTAKYDERVPTEVLDALAKLQPRWGVHKDYYFWSRSCTAKTLVSTWVERISELADEFLCFKDEYGEDIDFHSHCLRDTFAVEMLLDPEVKLEDVSRMLTHKDIGVTQRHYTPFVERRRRLLETKRIEALKRQGATFTPQLNALSTAPGKSPHREKHCIGSIRIVDVHDPGFLPDLARSL